jgi:integrase
VLELLPGTAPPRRSPITMPGYRTGKPAPNKGMKLPAEPLSRAEVEQLMKACSTRGSAGIRDRALIVLLYRTGLRIAEALALVEKDVDLEHGLVVVLRGKGVKRRTVGLDPTAAAVLERWLRRRRELAIPRTWQGRPATIFCVITRPRRGKPLHPSCVRESMKRLARRAGVDKRVHPHGFRHTHAFELAMEQTPLIIISKQLGHRSLSTTQRYVDHLAPGDVIAAMQARTWNGRPAAAVHSPDVLTELAALRDRLQELLPG